MKITDKINFFIAIILDISQEKYAKRISLTRITDHSWKSGLSKISIAHFIMISFICNVTINYLLRSDYPLELSVQSILEEEY